MPVLQLASRPTHCCRSGMSKRYESLGNDARNINCAFARYEAFVAVKMHTLIS